MWCITSRSAAIPNGRRPATAIPIPIPGPGPTAAEKKALVLGTHFAGTSAGYVVRAGDGYRFEMA